MVQTVDIMVKWARDGELNFIPVPDAHLMCPLAVAVAFITHLQSGNNIVASSCFEA